MGNYLVQIETGLQCIVIDSFKISTKETGKQCARCSVRCSRVIEYLQPQKAAANLVQTPVGDMGDGEKS